MLTPFLFYKISHRKFSVYPTMKPLLAGNSKVLPADTMFLPENDIIFSQHHWSIWYLKGDQGLKLLNFSDFYFCWQKFCQVKRLTELCWEFGVTMIVLEIMGAWGDVSPTDPIQSPWNYMSCTDQTSFFSWDSHCSHMDSYTYGFLHQMGHHCSHMVSNTHGILLQLGHPLLPYGQ